MFSPFIVLVGLAVFVFGTEGTTYDRNGCPVVNKAQVMKVFGSSCYSFDTYSHKGFLGAQKTCQKDGGNLVHIKSKQENDFIASEIKSNKWKGQFWIGLNDEDKDGKYIWTDGANFDINKGYSNFITGKLQVASGHCAVFDARFMDWFYKDCHWTNFLLGETPTLYFICEYQRN